MEGADLPLSNTLSRLSGTVTPKLSSQSSSIKGCNAAATEQRTQGGEHTPTTGDAPDTGVPAVEGVQRRAIGDHVRLSRHQHRTPRRLRQLGSQSASRFLRSGQTALHSAAGQMQPALLPQPQQGCGFLLIAPDDGRPHLL